MAARTIPVSATRATNDKITSSGWNAGPVASNTFLIGKPNFNAATAVQTLTNNTLMAVNLQQPVTQDSDGGFSSLAITKYTCQVPGWYMVCGAEGWAFNATGQRQVIIRKNGADIRAASTRNVSAGIVMSLATPVVLVQLAAADYLEVWEIQDSGSGMSSNTTSPTQGGLTAVWISS